jgi:hypothetical protein
MTANICCLAFFVATNFTKLKIIYNLTGIEKKFSQLIRKKKHFFTQKAVANLSEIWDEGNRAGIHDRESEIRDPGSEIPASEDYLTQMRNQRLKKHWIRIRNTAEEYGTEVLEN